MLPPLLLCSLLACLWVLLTACGRGRAAEKLERTNFHPICSRRLLGTLNGSLGVDPRQAATSRRFYIVHAKSQHARART